MTYLYTQLSLFLRLRAFHAGLALVSLFVFCAPNAKADVIYSYVAADAPSCSVVRPDCAYNAGTTFTIDSPGFLPFAATPFTYTPVTTADDLYIWPTDYGQLLDVIFLDPWDIGAVPTGTVTTPEPDAAVLSLTGMAVGMMEAMRRRLAGSRRKAAV